MKRTSTAILLLVHGVAHALPGMRATDGVTGWLSGLPTMQVELTRWLFTILWAGAVVGLLGGGFALLGARAFRGDWRRWALVGAGCSALLLVFGWHSVIGIVGLMVDLLIVVVAFQAPRSAAPSVAPRGRRARILNAVAATAVAILATLIVVRPWHMRWGSAGAELRAGLPGDELITDSPSYQIQHAVTINAPADTVWRWLVQLGEDRGGFYSYAWLERLFGIHVRNADRIHPEWQQVAAGDTIFATHRGWLGFDRRFGWRVARAEPGRVLYLEQWGAFVLAPVDARTTRLIVRTRGAGVDDLTAVLTAPLGLVLFEPAHFIMERKMLLTLKARAEAGHAGVL